MTKYRKKPIEVEAVKWLKHGDHPEVKRLPFLRHLAIGLSLGLQGQTHPDLMGWINTLEGGHEVTPGDYIIKGVAGEYYPCKPDIFEETYELATKIRKKGTSEAVSRKASKGLRTNKEKYDKMTQAAKNRFWRDFHSICGSALSQDEDSE